MANILNLFRGGAVGFIDWLDAGVLTNSDANINDSEEETIQPPRIILRYNRQTGRASCKNLLDYVTRRFNLPSALLDSRRGWNFAETPLNAISTPVKRSQPNQVPIFLGGRLVWMVPVFPEPTTQKKKL